MTREETGMAEGMTLEEQAEVARDFLQGLLARYGLDAAIETRVLDEETVEIAATGDGLGVLVGPKGVTLAALQDVTRTVVQRQCPGKTDRILVDVAGYREKRAAALQRFSQQVSAEVVETGTERALETMSPADRKVIHDSVKEIEGVTSRSEGEDPSRYIVIAPAS
jgi:spoIIIJ-associated protein